MLWLLNKAEVVEVFNEFALSCICGEGNHKKKKICVMACICQ